MTAFGAACFYAALLILGTIILQTRVILQRRGKRIGVGHGQDRDLQRAVRVHGNYAENVPFALAALILLGQTGAPVWPVHFVGVLMIVGRIAHAIGLTQSPGSSIGRVAGMVLTQAALLIGAIVLLMCAFGV